MTVFLFTGHRRAHCNPRHCDGCMLCHGGLFLCTTCGLGEGALTTHCPQVRCDWSISDAVYSAKCDFRDGQWVPGPSVTWEGTERGRKG